MDTKSGDKISFIMKVCGIKDCDVVEKMQLSCEETSVMYLEVKETTIGYLRKLKKRDAKKETVLSFARALIDAINEKKQNILLNSELSKEEKVIMKICDEITEEIFYNDKKYYKLYIDIYNYLQTENLLNDFIGINWVYLPECIKYAPSEDDVALMETQEEELQVEELKKTIFSLKKDAQGFVVNNWKQLIRLGKYCSNVYFSEFMDALLKTNFEKITDTINMNCKLAPVDVMENASKYSFFITFDFSPYEMKESKIEKNVEHLIRKERGIDLDNIVPILENIKYITKENMDIMYKIACSDGEVSYKKGMVKLSFDIKDS